MNAKTRLKKLEQAASRAEEENVYMAMDSSELLPRARAWAHYIRDVPPEERKAEEISFLKMWNDLIAGHPEYDDNDYVFVLRENPDSAQVIK